MFPGAEEVEKALLFITAHSMPLSAAYIAYIESLDEETRMNCFRLTDRIKAAIASKIDATMTEKSKV